MKHGFYLKCRKLTLSTATGLALASPFAGLTGLAAAADTVEALSASALIKEVMSVSESPHVFDWRRSSLNVSLGPVHYMENNSFSSSAFGMGFGIPTDSGDLFRFGIRRVKMSQTYSSDLIAKTPFTQSAQMTRFEFPLHYGLNILEGRNISVLSPGMGDVEAVLWFLGGGTYSFPTTSAYPRKGMKPKPMPGQHPVNSKVVLEFGLLWQIFFPSSLGLHLEYVYHFPLEDTGNLLHWTHLAGGLSWAFGVQ